MCSFTLFVIEIYDTHSIFYSRKIVSQKNTIKSRFVIEILSNFNIASSMKEHWKLLFKWFMLLCLFTVLLIPFPRTFFIKSNANNGRNPPSCPFTAIITFFLVIAFIDEEATDCFNEEAIGAIRVPRNPLYCFFTFLLFKSHHQF